VEDGVHRLQRKAATSADRHISGKVIRAGIDFPELPCRPANAGSITIVLLLAVAAIGIRVFYWQATNLTLEDALISFRYAENLAAGRGFVYNEGEHVIGTTSPLWTLLLASVKFAGLNVITASKLLGILFESLTLFLIIAVVRMSATSFSAMAAAVFIAFSPDIVSISVSGMETSLLLCCMAVALLGYVQKNLLLPFGLALTIMTRIDGVVFAGCLLGGLLCVNARFSVRAVLYTALLLVPWFAFAFFYTGHLLPQSVLAKMVTYRFDLTTSTAPFVSAFTPFLEHNVMTWIAKAMLTVGIAVGGLFIVRNHRQLTPVMVFFVVYCLVFMFSRGLIFRWYTIPATFAACIALGVFVDRVTSPIHERRTIVRVAVILLIAAGSFMILKNRIVRDRQLQAFEEEFRKPIGLWLRDNLNDHAIVLLEPIGYIGYYAGQNVTVKDEIGIVAPEIVRAKKSGPAWYSRALDEIQPDYVIQYEYSLQKNRMEGTGELLFADDDDARRFEQQYTPVKTFNANESFVFLHEKEKAFVVFRRK
jgi:hypothetical protein